MSTGYESEWQRVYGVDRDPIRQHIIYPFIDGVLEKLAPKNIVDVGCGNGGLLLRCSPLRFSQAIGIDSSEQFVDFANRNNGDSRVRFALGDLTESLPVPDAWADLIFCVFVLNEVESLYQPSLELARALNVCGKLIVVMTHPFQLLYESLRRDVPWKLRGELNYFRTSEHEYRFTLSSASARYYNHNFESIVGSFDAARLRCHDFRELGLNPDVYEEFPQYSEKRDLPLYLAFVASRMPCSFSEDVL